eukprot:5658037-Alexandrium_andersonii.AAC.1
MPAATPLRSSPMSPASEPPASRSSAPSSSIRIGWPGATSQSGRQQPARPGCDSHPAKSSRKPSSALLSKRSD